MQHPDEGTIHAWLDGELPEGQVNEIAAHASDCPECSAKVAEARGLIAASTRILTALDNVPAGVIPEEAGTLPVPVRRRRWYDRTDIRAAAAVMVVAGASYLVVQRDSGTSRQTLMVADKIQAAPTPAVNGAAVEPPVAAQKAAQPSARKSPPAETEINKALSTASIIGKKTMAPTAPTAPTASHVDAVTADAAAPAFGAVEGRVVDQKNDRGLVGASVSLPSASLYTSTDKDGRFSITNVPVGEQHLTVRRIGYEPQNIVLAVPDDASVKAEIVLEPQTMSLSQVVVTGAAATGNVASPSLRALNVNSFKATHRTVYEISGGVRVMLTDSPVDAGKDETDFAQEHEKVAPAVMAAGTPASAINTISWTERGRRYLLSGPLTTNQLEALKPRLMQLRQ